MRIQISESFSYRKLIRFTIPTITMMIFTSIYSVVDGIFVSNFVGSAPFAALNLIFPAVMMLGAVGFMIGTGGSALVAKTLGEGKSDQANRYFSMLILCVVISGLALTVLGLLTVRRVAMLLGATGTMLEDCVLYGGILLFGNVAFMLQNSFQSFLVVAERPQLGLGISILAGVTNMVSDFLLIYVFRLGLAGAAWATVLSQVVGGIVPLIFFLCKNSTPLRLVQCRFDGRALWKSCMNGSSEMLTNLSMSLVNMLYNMQLMKYAGSDGVAAYGIIMYISFVFVATFLGYSIGVSPIVSYHYGAGHKGELKSLFQKSLVLVIVSSVVLTGVAEGLSGVLAGIFVSYDKELLAMTTTAIRLYGISFLVNGINIFGSAFFTALNNGAVSALISFLRTLLFQVATILIMPLIWGLNGIWLAIVAAEFLALVVTAVCFAVNRKKYQYI
ncbi:MAG: MATE family efflux transporter [Roseburia sp.]|jgi:putative MATE family efflux protein|nr:MATE family efflux transporter [Roseburia sp.]